MWISPFQITHFFFFCCLKKKRPSGHTASQVLSLSVWSSNRFRYCPVPAVSSLPLSRRSSVGTRRRWLTVVKLFGGGVDRKMATSGSACVFLRDAGGRRCIRTAGSRFTARVDFNWCESGPVHVCWSPHVGANVCVDRTPTVRPQRQQT